MYCWKPPQKYFVGIFYFCIALSLERANELVKLSFLHIETFSYAFLFIHNSFSSNVKSYFNSFSRHHLNSFLINSFQIYFQKLVEFRLGTVLDRSICHAGEISSYFFRQFLYITEVIFVSVEFQNLSMNVWNKRNQSKINNNNFFVQCFSRFKESETSIEEAHRLWSYTILFVYSDKCRQVSVDECSSIEKRSFQKKFSELI